MLEDRLLISVSAGDLAAFLAPAAIFAAALWNADETSEAAGDDIEGVASIMDSEKNPMPIVELLKP